MIIQEYYYNEENGLLLIEFSTSDDGDNFYRVLKLELNTIQYYSPTIVNEYDLHNIDEYFIIELITEYLKDNDLPDQLNL